MHQYKTETAALWCAICGGNGSDYVGCKYINKDYVIVGRINIVCGKILQTSLGACLMIHHSLQDIVVIIYIIIR